MTIFCTIGATKNAVGKATKKARKKDLIQIRKNFSTNPRLIKIIAPDMTQAIINAIKKGKRTRGVFSFIKFKAVFFESVIIDNSII